MKPNFITSNIGLALAIGSTMGTRPCDLDGLDLKTGKDPSISLVLLGYKEMKNIEEREILRLSMGDTDVEKNFSTLLSFLDKRNKTFYPPPKKISSPPKKFFKKSNRKR